MNSLAQLIAQETPYDAYRRTARENDTASLQSVQQAHGLMGILAQMQAADKARREEALMAKYQTDIAGASTDEERSRLAGAAVGPQGQLTHQDNVLKQKALHEATMGRLQNAASQFSLMHDIRMKNATTGANSRS